MRILSQDRTASVDESGTTLSVFGNCVIAALSDATFERITLGKYKSKERAMEIRADIHALHEELPFSGSTVFYMPME